MQKYSTQQIKMKSKKLLLLFVFALFMVTLTGCAGADGLIGPEGPAGQTGAAGPAGPAGSDGLDGADGLDGIGLPGETGAQGPAGLDGVDGVNGANGMDGIDGIDGLDGAAGLSAFEIYMLYFPGYVGTESEWIVELSTNSLTLNLTVVYNNGVSEDVIFLNGQILGESPYTVGWFLDAAFADLADEEYITEAMMVYINIAGEQVVEPVYPDTYKIDSKEDVASSLNDKVVSGTNVFILDENVYLYNADGTFNSFGASVFGNLAVNQILADIVVSEGKVIEMRFASAVTGIKTMDVKVVKTVTISSSSALDIYYGTTVETLLASIVPTDGNPQTYKVMDSAAKEVTTGLLEATDTLVVKSENGLATDTYSFAFVGDVSNKTLVAEATPVLKELTIGATDLTVRPNSAPADLLASIKVVNATYETIIEVFNSELVAKSSTTLATGDKVVVTSIDGTKDIYKVEVVKSANTALMITDTAIVSPTSITDKVLDTETVVNYLFNATLAEVAGSLEAEMATSPQTNTWTITVAAVVYTFDGTNFAKADGTLLKDSAEVAYSVNDKVSVLQAAGTLGLSVKAQDTTTVKAYTFSENASLSTAIQPVASNMYVTAAMEATTGNTISINATTTVAELQTAVSKEDGSALGTVVVKKSDGTTRAAGIIYNNDTVVITSTSTTKTADYLVSVGAESNVTTLPLVASPAVITSSEFSTALLVKPNIRPASTNIPTSEANITADLLTEGFNFQTYSKLMINPAYTYAVLQGTTPLPAMYTNFVLNQDKDQAGPGTALTTLDDMIVRVFAQSYDATTNPSAFMDYDVILSAKSSNAVIETVASYDEKLVQSFASGFINVHYQKLETNGSYTVQANITTVLSQFDFAKNYQTAVAGHYGTLNDPTTWVGTYSTFEDIVVRVYSEAYHVTNNPMAYTDYSINYFYNTSTLVQYKETTKVVDPLLGFVTINSQYWNGTSYATTLYTDVAADINKGLTFQTIETVMVNPAYTYAVLQGTTPLPAMYTNFVLNQDKDQAGPGTALTTLSDLIIRVTAQSSTIAIPNVQDYPVYVKLDSTDTMLHASTIEVAADALGNGVFVDNFDTTITVKNASTVADLLAALDLTGTFQEVAIELNDGTVKTTQTTYVLNSYDVLIITAQDDTEKEYTIMVADAVTAPSASTTVASGTIYTVAGMVISVDKEFTPTGATKAVAMTEAELLAKLQTANPKLSFEFITSDGADKAEDQLFSFDLLVVTAEDGTTTATYTIVVLP